MKTLIALTAVATLSGCCASVARIEIEHVSHPDAGPPFSPSYMEDGLTQINGILRWELGRGIYTEQGLGYNLEGRNGGGFKGPTLTYTGRIGVEFSLKD